MTDLDPKTLLERAAKHRLPYTTESSIRFDRAEVETVLPHRAPFLFLDSIDWLDTQQGAAAASLTLHEADAVFEGHFPGAPVWPGMLQVEAIGQLGLFAHLKKNPERAADLPALTHVLGARFMHPISPPTTVTFVANTYEDGLFFTVVGQCIAGGQICSAAAVRGL